MWNGSSNYADGNSYLAGDVVRVLEPPLFRLLSRDARYPGG